MPQGWPAIAERRPHYVIFGETHGTREAPAFVGRIACALASDGERLLVAVEQSATDNAALQAAWRLPADRFEPALGAAGWAGREDGVASEAMFALLVRLHGLKEAGVAVDVAAFNGMRDDAQRARLAGLPGQGPHEAAQAENIRDAAAAGDYDRILILVGSFHARKSPVGEGADRFEPMAMRLARYGPTTSLRMRDAGGSMWNCIPKPGTNVRPGQPITADKIDCGIHPTRGDSDLKRAPFMQLGPFPGGEPGRDYDGFIWLGPVSGSPPLVAGK